MQLLYKAYACEPLDGDGKVLLPGYPAVPNGRRLQPGDKIQVELADGTRLHTTVVKTQFMSFEDEAASRLRASPGFYCAIRVSSDFDAPGIELGAAVYLEDSHNAA
jgi:hypothetical protein